MPLLLMAGTAAGDARNLMSSAPASGSLAPTAMPAENTVTFWIRVASSRCLALGAGAGYVRCAGDKRPALPDCWAVDEASRVARNEHEHLGGIAEAVIADSDPADHIEWDMIEKDQAQPNSAKQIEPASEVASVFTKLKPLLPDPSHHQDPAIGRTSTK
jgi:hypothetical protein